METGNGLDRARGFLEIYAKGIVTFGGQRGICPRRTTR
jgi:hypothetical protein